MPKTLGNQKLEWSIEKENLSITIFVLVLILCISYFFAYQVQIRKNDQLEKEQMQQEYSEIVSKLALLFGAGMTIRGALQRIYLDVQKNYEKQKIPFCYEGIRQLLVEIECGNNEVAAYENWGKRSRMQEYIKLSSIIIQCSKQGNKEIQRVLYEEDRKSVV